MHNKLGSLFNLESIEFFFLEISEFLIRILKKKNLKYCCIQVNGIKEFMSKITFELRDLVW